MPLIAPLWPWLVGLLGTLVTNVASWWLLRVAADRAFHYALVTAFLVASTGLFLTLTLTVKALILGARAAMPANMSAFTYFLPSDINVIFATIVTLRVSVAVYRWTVSTMSAYLPMRQGGIFAGSR